MAQNLKERKQSSRRTLAALNFLSNISLDGSHKDTRLSIFTHKGSNSLIHRNFKKRTRSRDGGNSPHLKPLTDHGRQLTVASFHSNFSSKTGETIGDSSFTSCLTEIPDRNENAAQSVHTSLQRSISSATEKASDSQNKPNIPSLDIPLLTIKQDDIDSANISWNLSEIRPRTRTLSEHSDTFDSRHEIKFVDKSRLRHMKFQNERVVLLSKSRSPVAVFSTLPFTARKPPISMSGVFTKIGNEVVEGVSGRRRRVSGRQSANVDQWLESNVPGYELIEEMLEKSYSQYLNPVKQPSDSFSSSSRYLSLDNIPEMLQAPHSPFLRSISFEPSILYQRPPVTPNITDKGLEFEFDMYNPNLLDDPELKSGKHRRQMAFSSYLTSVIHYVKPSELKKDLNEMFKERFPSVQLTLSKLRSLKRDIKKLLHAKCGADLWSVATAYVYFEKLILKGFVNKQNRKLTCGACILLAGKLNDVSRNQDIKDLIEEIEDMFRVHKKELLTFEFDVLVALEFSLHIGDNEVYPHYQRLTTPS